MHLTDFKVLTFDCYGPLIDWETGIVNALRPLFGSELGYYAEFEFPDSDTFKAAAATDEFKATGTDAAELGIPHSVYVADVNG